MKINEYIRYARRKKDMTAKDLADAVGTSRATVSKWESGQIRHISPTNLKKLSKVLDVDFDTLIAEREIEPYEEPEKVTRDSEKVRKMAVRIKERRTYAGLSQEELAKRLGVSKYTISKWECRKVPNIPARYIERMAQMFGVRTTFLYGIDDEPDDVESFFTIMLQRPEIKDLFDQLRIASKHQVDAIRRLLVDLNGDANAKRQYDGDIANGKS